MAEVEQTLDSYRNQRHEFEQIPVGLSYHILFSIGVAVFWALVIKFAWPSEIEAWVDGSNLQIDEEYKSAE